MRGVLYAIGGAALLFSLVYAIIGFVAVDPVQADMQAEQSVPSVLSTVTTGTTGQGDVMIDMTPHAPQEGGLVVDVRANTHSVDLSQFDLSTIVTIEQDGEKRPPVSAPRLSGHHAGGELVFDDVDASRPFTIEIVGIPAVPTRTFSWEGI